MFLRRKDVQPPPLEANKPKVLSSLDPRFRDPETGQVIQEKYLEYLRSLREAGELPAQEDEEATEVDAAIARFLGYREEEAQVITEFHSWPNNLPWNKQPWWKWHIWRCYWDGRAEGREDR